MRTVERWLDEGWSPWRIGYGAVNFVALSVTVAVYVTYPHHPGAVWWLLAAVAVVTVWSLGEMARWRIRHNRLQQRLQRLADTVAPPATPEASQPPARQASLGVDVPENTSAILTATSEPRVMCPLSPMQLTRLFSQGATELQSESLVTQYRGQWRQVSATVEQVVRQNEYVISVSGKDSEQVTVTLFFKPTQWAARLQGLMRGDPVSAIGQVDLVDQSHVIFNHCELV